MGPEILGALMPFLAATCTVGAVVYGVKTLKGKQAGASSFKLGPGDHKYLLHDDPNAQQEYDKQYEKPQLTPEELEAKSKAFYQLISDVVCNKMSEEDYNTTLEVGKKLYKDHGMQYIHVAALAMYSVSASKYQSTSPQEKTQ